MMEKRLSIPYGKGSLNFSLDSKRLLGILEKRSQKTKDVRVLLKEAVEDSPKLTLSRRSKDRRAVLLVVPDSTRKAHLKEILPDFLKLLAKFSKVDIVAATGLHLEHSEEELKELVGERIYRHYKIFSHNQDSKGLANFGPSKSGFPIILNKRLKEYDGIITIGVIEPHLYAGFSGGAKTVSIGLAGEEIVNATHDPAFIDDSRVAIGRIRGNPFQRVLWEIAGKVPVIFSLNIVNDSGGNAVKIFAGRLHDVFEKGVRFCRRIYQVEVRDKAEIVICGVGSPKDANLYQASRAVNYILDSGRPILKEDGFLVVAAELKDGLGKGLAERRCFEALRSVYSKRFPCGSTRKALEKFIKYLKAKGCLGGEHRAYMIAKAMLKARIIFVGREAPKVAAGLPFVSFKTIEESLRYIDREIRSKGKMYVVPRALSVIAEVR